MRANIIIAIILCIAVGLSFISVKTLNTALIEENASSHSGNENVIEEDVIFYAFGSDVSFMTSSAYAAFHYIYESPVKSVLMRPPKFSA